MEGMDDDGLAAVVAVAKSIQDAGLAKKEDLANLSEKITGTANKVDMMEAPIETLGKLAANKVRTGNVASRSSTPARAMGRRSTGTRTTATSSSNDAEWKLKVIRVRGWAPLGCLSTPKLQKHEAIETYKQIATFFDAELQQALVPTPPFLLNHSLG